MDNSLIIVLVVTVSSYVIFGLLFFHTVKTSNSSPEQKLQYLRSIVSTASLSIEHRHPSMHPKEKKAQITQLVMVTLAEQKYQENVPFTIDMLVEEAMLQADTDPRLRAIRFSSEDTRQITPPLGLMSLGARHKAVQRTGKLV